MSKLEELIERVKNEGVKIVDEDGNVLAENVKPSEVHVTFNDPEEDGEDDEPLYDADGDDDFDDEDEDADFNDDDFGDDD